MKLPVIIMLALMPLVLTAYAEAPSHVDVYDYPFNITLLEGGNFTLYNNATNNIYFDGAFEGMVYCGSISGEPACDGFDNSKTFELPANVFTPDTYYLKDKSISGSNLVSSITIEKPQVNFNATSSETLGSFEPISNSTFVEPTIVPVTPATQEEDDIITSSSVSIPTRESDYYTQDLVSYYDGRIYNSQGYDITPPAPILNDPVEEVVQETKSTSDTEVLNLRLEILKVIESIFRLVLQ